MDAVVTDYVWIKQRAACMRVTVGGGRRDCRLKINDNRWRGMDGDGMYTHALTKCFVGALPGMQDNSTEHCALQSYGECAIG